MDFGWLHHVPIINTLCVSLIHFTYWDDATCDRYTDGVRVGSVWTQNVGRPASHRVESYTQSASWSKILRWTSGQNAENRSHRDWSCGSHCFFVSFLEDAMAILVAHRTCDLQVAGSSPLWAPLRSGLAQATYTCVSLSPSSIIWYRPRGVISLAGKVTAGLVESNSSLPPGLWLMSPAGWLPRNRFSFVPNAVIEYWTTTTLVGEASARLIACTSAEACQFGPIALFLPGKPVCLLIRSLVRDHFMNVTVWWLVLVLCGF